MGKDAPQRCHSNRRRWLFGWSRPPLAVIGQIDSSAATPHHAGLCYILSGGTEMKTFSIREMREALGQLDRLAEPDINLAFAGSGVERLATAYR